MRTEWPVCIYDHVLVAMLFNDSHLLTQRIHPIFMQFPVITTSCGRSANCDGPICLLVGISLRTIGLQEWAHMDVQRKFVYKIISLNKYEYLTWKLKAVNAPNNTYKRQNCNNNHEGKKVLPNIYDLSSPLLLYWNLLTWAIMNNHPLHVYSDVFEHYIKIRTVWRTGQLIEKLCIIEIGFL